MYYIVHSLFPVKTSLAAAAPARGFWTRHWYTPVSDACTLAKVRVDWGPGLLYCTRLELTRGTPFSSHAHMRGAVPVAVQVRLEGREAYWSVLIKDCTMVGGTGWREGGKEGEREEGGGGERG